MARGITELDVHHAADDLVAGGERPTVERIRAHLGTGSPNTVVRHLDSWWSSVGARLRQRAIEQGRPQLPLAVDTLAQRCWTTALEMATEHAHAALAGQRDELEAARATWEAQWQAERERQAEREALLDQARHQANVQETAVAALREQLQQLAIHADDLQRQRDGAFARNDRLDQQLATTTAQLEALGRQHEQERGELRAHIRATEEHALGEIDRARQALREVERSASAAHARHARDLASAETARRQADAAMATAQRELHVQTALAERSAAQLAALGDLPQQLRAALEKATPQAPRGRRRSAPTAP
ncbi:DNA-binding protein [Stenotrophomonas sp. NPDC077659]|uniref:DNA-binding protein n=1 Tax=Stenotrophomonas sp. NPDC077659 TaxID=3390694 RepID=UPI003D05018A